VAEHPRRDLGMDGAVLGQDVESAIGQMSGPPKIACTVT